jgi:hypothetical protein
MATSDVIVLKDMWAWMHPDQVECVKAWEFAQIADAAADDAWQIWKARDAVGEAAAAAAAVACEACMRRDDAENPAVAAAVDAWRGTQAETLRVVAINAAAEAWQAWEKSEIATASATKAWGDAVMSTETWEAAAALELKEWNASRT